MNATDTPRCGRAIQVFQNWVRKPFAPSSLHERLPG